MTEKNIQISFLTIAALVINLILAPLASASDNLLFVTITTETCYSCQKLKPVIEELEYEYYGRIDFITLDVSNKYSIEESRRIAQEKGIIDYFEENKGVTPRVGILCPEHTKAEKIFTGETRKEIYKEALDHLLLEGTAICSL